MRMDFTYTVMVDDHPCDQIEYVAEFKCDDDDASDWELSRLFLEAVWWEKGPDGEKRCSKEVEIKQDHWLYDRFILEALQSRHEIDAAWQEWLIENEPEVAAEMRREYTSLELHGRV